MKHFICISILSLFLRSLSAQPYIHFSNVELVFYNNSSSSILRVQMFPVGASYNSDDELNFRSFTASTSGKIKYFNNVVNGLGTEKNYRFDINFGQMISLNCDEGGWAAAEGNIGYGIYQANLTACSSPKFPVKSKNGYAA